MIDLHTEGKNVYQMMRDNNTCPKAENNVVPEQNFSKHQFQISAGLSRQRAQNHLVHCFFPM